MDFEEVDFSGHPSDPSVLPRYQCTRIEENDQAYYYRIARLVHQIPAAAPLIPGKRIERLVANRIPREFEEISNSIIGKDLVVTHPKYDVWNDVITGLAHPVI